MVKICRKCKIEKLESCFHKMSKERDGLRSECKECRKSSSKLHYEKNSLIIAKKSKELYAQNSNEIKERVKRYRENNKDAVNARKTKWNKENAERLAAYKLAYEKKRMAEDPNYRLARKLRKRLKQVLKGKGSKAVEFLGCTVNEARLYLESLWQPGMTWENHSFRGWHIDHIKPLVSFDLTDEEQLKQACHYSNLQPLWMKDNLRKWSF